MRTGWLRVALWRKTGWGVGVGGNVRLGKEQKVGTLLLVAGDLAGMLGLLGAGVVASEMQMKKSSRDMMGLYRELTPQMLQELR